MSNPAQTRSPSDRPASLRGGVAVMLRSMQVGQLVIAAVLVCIGAVRAIADGTPVVLAVAASLVFAGWYFGGIVLTTRAHDQRISIGWMLGLVVIWAGAVTISVEFVWLAFALWLLGGLILRVRWAIVYSLAVFAVVVIAPIAHHGTIAFANVIGPLVGGLFAFGVSRGYLEMVRDSQERQRLVESLLHAQSEMVELQQELARTQRESGAIAERTRLSRDIHDTIAQGFTSIGLLARGALQQEGARPEAGHGGAAAARVLEQIDALARDSLVDVRRIVAALAPAELDEGALAGAIARMLGRLEAEAGISTELRVDAPFPALPTAVEVALLRTAQSALANVRQHAAATRVVVSLADAEHTVRLDIVDDGRGFDVRSWDRAGRTLGASGYGLHSMRDRLRELGGGLEVESAPGDGTALSAFAPYAQITPYAQIIRRDAEEG